jgi:hypothetical protein
LAICRSTREPTRSTDPPLASTTAVDGGDASPVCLIARHHSIIPKGNAMSARNGDKARFQKNRQRKLAKRQRIQALVARTRGDGARATPVAKS